MNRFRRRFIKTSDNEFGVRISDGERTLLADLVPQLRELLMSTSPTGDVDPDAKRLFPTAYAEDPDDDDAYQELMRDQLLVSRLETLDVLESTIHAKVLTTEEIDAWTNGINQIRLVLGTRLDISEEDQPSDIDPDDPATVLLGVYHYLGHLLGEILDVRMR